MLITNPAQRTKALNLWESQEVDWRHPNQPIKITTARAVVNNLWNLFGHRGNPPPEIRWGSSHPYCQGRSLIVLTDSNHMASTLLHEFVHALGFGTRCNPHTPGFVVTYVKLMSRQFKWHEEELLYQVRVRRLI